MRKPNYRFERAERDRAKKARNDKKLQRQQERAATRADWNRGDCPQSPPGALFHVPSQELPRVLAELSATLRSRGVLFCSNPRGNNEEGFSDAFAKMPSKRLFGNFIARKFCWRTLALRIGASHGHEFRRSIQAHDVVA